MNSLFMYACEKGWIGMVKRLLPFYKETLPLYIETTEIVHGTRNYMVGDGEEPCIWTHTIFKYLSYDMTKLLLEHGADPNILYKKLPFLAKALLDNFKIAELLLIHGANPTKSLEYVSNIESIKLLVKYKADIFSIYNGEYAYITIPSMFGYRQNYPDIRNFIYATAVQQLMIAFLCMDRKSVFMRSTGDHSIHMRVMSYLY